MKVDFYKFQCFSIGYPYDVCKKTLTEAKEVYRQMKFKGYRLSCFIYGCTEEDSSIFLTFTPWWEEDYSFGRTIHTYLGEKYLKRNLTAGLPIRV